MIPWCVRWAVDAAFPQPEQFEVQHGHRIKGSWSRSATCSNALIYEILSVFSEKVVLSQAEGDHGHGGVLGRWVQR